MTFLTDSPIVSWVTTEGIRLFFITAFVVQVSSTGGFWFISVGVIIGRCAAFRCRGMGRVTPHDGHTAR